MKFLKFGLLFAFLCLNVSPSFSQTNEAVTECAKEHNIELSSLSTVRGTFSNGKCMLECTVGSVVLPVDLMHEGQACPEDSTGLCQQGHCVGGLEEALLECGLEHRVDFHKAADHRGTGFINDKCMLKCVLGVTEMSVNHKHEGSKCPTNPSGVCRSGLCVVQSTNPGTTVTQTPTTFTQSPTTFTPPSIDSFSPSKMKLLNISLLSTVPSLNQDEHIELHFYATEVISNMYLNCTFYGNPAKQNSCLPQDISAIISAKLTKTSLMLIDLFESSAQLTLQHEALYPLLAGFYVNHKLSFGEQENFVTKFPIYRDASPHEKLMDVELRFTIVFSKD